MTPSADALAQLRRIVGEQHVLLGEAIPDDVSHDECLTVPPQRPAAVVRPATTDEVAAVVAWANEHHVPLTARGSGTGLSGAAVPRRDGVVVSFARMSAVREIDDVNHVAVVQPGVTLAELDAATADRGLVYPVSPGENSATLGGNIATNAGGMRAVRYGVTRHQVLGLTAVLGTGEVVRTGGRFTKVSSGYDLTQLLVGSEGTLALVTEAVLRLYPRLPHAATVLAPFGTLDDVTAAVPRLVGSHLQPTILEYVDVLLMASLARNADLELGVPQDVQDRTRAYLIVVLEQRTPQRLADDVEVLGEQLTELGALDVYVLDGSAGSDLIKAREKAFWGAKAAGANEILDVVVPRAAIPTYLHQVQQLASRTQSLIVGCGHVGDGNVHLSVFQPDAAVCERVVHDVVALGVELGGAVSGEHGVGRAKKALFAELEPPAKLAAQRQVKAVFDPNGVLNPGVVFD